MRALELAIPPLVLTGIVAAGMTGLALALPAMTLAWPGHTACGIGLAIVGAGIATGGVIAFRKAGTTVDPRDPHASSAFVASGIYRYSRNPMYLGFLLALAGLAAVLANVASAALLPVFVAYLDRFQIAPEERALLHKFGAPYARYMGMVRRWL
jgi:protein-S-isoprenylcysteine O-methyltransferase Ste14